MSRSLLLGALLLLCQTALCAVPLLPPCTQESDVTDLGAEILSLDLPGAGETALVLTIPGGVSGEGEQLGSGLAFLAKEFVLRRLRADQLQEDSPYAGAALEAELTPAALTISLCGLREEVREGTARIFKVLSALKAEEGEFAELKSQLLACQAQEEGDEEGTLWSLWRRTAYRGTPLAAPLTGFSAQAEKLRPADLDRYLARHLVAGNIRAALAGSLKGHGLEETVREGLGLLRRGVLLGAENPRGWEGLSSRFAMRKSDSQLSLFCVGLSLPFEKGTGLAPGLLARRLLEARKGVLEKRLGEELRAQIGVDIIFQPEPQGFSLGVRVESLPSECAKARALVTDWLLEFGKGDCRSDEVRRESLALLRELAADCARPLDLAKITSQGSLYFANTLMHQALAEKLSGMGAGELNGYLERNLVRDRLVTVWSDPRENPLGAEEFLKLERELLESGGYGYQRYALPGRGELTVQQRDDETLVRCAFVFLGGNLYETTYNNGVFAVLNEFLAAGGGRGSDFAKALARSGGLVEPIVSPHLVGFLATVPAAGFGDLLPELCRAVAAPKISAATAEEARNAALRRLVAQTTNNYLSAELLACQTLFPEMALGLNRFGNPFVLERVAEKDIAAFRREYLTPDNLEIVVSGPVEARVLMQQVMKELRDYFGSASFAGVEHRSQRPRILPDEGEDSPWRRKPHANNEEYSAPREDAFCVVAQALPGILNKDGGLALPYLFSDALSSSLPRVLKRLREAYGPGAVLDSGAGRCLSCEDGYAFLWLSTRKDCSEEAARWLQRESCAAISNLLSPEGLRKAAEAAGERSRLYGRDARGFVLRAATHCLVTTNEFTDIPRNCGQFSPALMEEVLGTCQGPVLITVKPEESRF